MEAPLLTLPIIEATSILTLPIAKAPPPSHATNQRGSSLLTYTANQNSSDLNVLHIKISSVLFFYMIGSFGFK